MTSESGKGSMAASVKALVDAGVERGVWHALLRVDKYPDRAVDGHPDEVLEVEGNILQNAGIQLLLDLLAALGGTAYTNSGNAYLAVGDNARAQAEDATETNFNPDELDRKQATASVSGSVVTFQATFNDDNSLGDWEEVGVFNNAAADTGALLNRFLSTLGTKGAGQTWVLTLTITIT